MSTDVGMDVDRERDRDVGQARGVIPAAGMCSLRRRCARNILFPLVLGVTLLASACASTSAAPPPTSPGSASIAEFQVPTAAAAPDLLIAAPDGTLWFTEVNTMPARVGHITATGAITEIPLPTADAVPFGLAWGPDGNLWILLSGATHAHPGGIMLRLAPGGQMTSFALPPVGIGRPYANNLTVGPDGALWFTQSAIGTIGRMTLSGAVSEHALPDAYSAPGSIVAGPDGNLWFTEFQAHRIGRMTLAGFVSEFTVTDSAGQFLSAIVAGPQHALWFTDASGFTSPLQRPPDFLGRVTLDGAITLVPLPIANTSPRGIVVGQDGSLWFTEASPAVSRIGRLTPTGALTEYTLPTTASEPADIAVGPGGVLWFTEAAADRIGRLSPTRSP